MAEESQEPSVKPEQFPGWNPDYDLTSLIGLVSLSPLSTRTRDLARISHKSSAALRNDGAGADFPGFGSLQGVDPASPPNLHETPASTRPPFARDEFGEISGLASGGGPADPSVPTGSSLLAGKKVVVRSIQDAHRPSNLPVARSEDAHVQRLPEYTGSPGKSRLVFHCLMAAVGALACMALVSWLVMKTLDFTNLKTFPGAGSDDMHLLVDPGEALPDFTGHLLVEGVNQWNDTVSTEDLIGKNTVMLVWGSWNEELVAWSQDLNYQRLVDFDSSNTRFLGLNLDKSREDAMATLNEDMADWPHIFNYSENQESAAHPMQLLGIQQSPLILIIDSTGRLRAQGLKPGEVVEAYRTLFGRQSGSAP